MTLNKFGILLLLASFGLLIPGIFSPIISLTGTVDKAALVELGKQTLASDPDVPAFVVGLSEQIISQLDVSGDIDAFNKTRSIVDSVEELYRSDNILVAFLIALFSILVPVAKSLLLLFASVCRNQALALRVHKAARLVSKWSMADVFVIAIFVAFLAANATQQNDDIFFLTAELAEGFYYFLGYCLLSILSAQLMSPPQQARSGS